MKRRYKLLLIIVISFLLAIFIYKVFHKTENIYVFIGDDFSSSYSFNDYLKKEYSLYFRLSGAYEYVSEINRDIANNHDEVNYYLKNASLVVLSLPVYELNNYHFIDYNITVDYLNEVYSLLSETKKKTSNKVVLINLNGQEYPFINAKIEKYARDLELIYIKENDVQKINIIPFGNNKILTPEGHKLIYDQIKKSV